MSLNSASLSQGPLSSMRALWQWAVAAWKAMVACMYSWYSELEGRMSQRICVSPYVQPQLAYSPEMLAGQSRCVWQYWPAFLLFRAFPQR